MRLTRIVMMVQILEEDKFDVFHEWPPKLKGLKGSSKPPLNMRAMNTIMAMEALFAKAEVSGKPLPRLIEEEWSKYDRHYGTADETLLIGGK